MKLPAVVSNGGDGGGMSVWRVLSLTAAAPRRLYPPHSFPIRVAPSRIFIFSPLRLSISALRFVPSTLGTPACITRHYSPDTCSRYLCRVLSRAHSTLCLPLLLSLSLRCAYVCKVQERVYGYTRNGRTTRQVHIVHCRAKYR